MSESRSLLLDSPLQFVRSVGPKRAEAFASQGLHKVKDLLHYIPFSYIDRTSIHTLAEILNRLRKEELSGVASPEQFSDISIKTEFTVTATIISVKEKKFGAGKRSMLIVTVRDESHVQADCVYFNMVPYFKNILTQGSLISISGTLIMMLSGGN